MPGLGTHMVQYPGAPLPAEYPGDGSEGAALANDVNQMMHPDWRYQSVPTLGGPVTVLTSTEKDRMGYYRAGGATYSPNVNFPIDDADSKTYYTKARLRQIGRAGSMDAPYSDARRYRRTNPLNPRALRRAMRRVQMFAKFARHTMTFTQHHKLKHHRRKR